MTIDEFAAKYPATGRSAETVVRRWVIEKKVRDFLGLPALGGVTIADLLLGDKLVDTLSPEVREAFSHLMEGAADTRAEIERLLVEKIDLGGGALLGLINKVQGQLGEDAFVRLVGSAARLAGNKSQEGWDVRVGLEPPFEYVQVKVYKDADAVVDHLARL